MTTAADSTVTPAATMVATSPEGSALSRPERSNSAARMPPSLNQLAARINPPSSSSSSTSASRPRLAAQFLRTGSQVSLTSNNTSNADSMAVNAPTTRSVSPVTSSSSRASSPTASVSSAPSGGDPLTTDRVEKLNAEVDKKPARVGYKNIPSLDAITARMAMTRSLSIDGSPKPPEPETYEDPATPGIPQKKPEHPLQHSWTIYHDSKTKPAFHAEKPSVDATAGHPTVETDEYEAGLTVISFVKFLANKAHREPAPALVE